MNARIGICLGDVTGIGPEVTLKALAAERDSSDFRFLLIGDAGHIQRTNERLRLNLPIRGAEGESGEERFAICEASRQALPDGLKSGAPEAARAAVSWLREAARLCVAGKLEAMITAPVNKEAIMRAGERFVGQTEL